MQKTLIHIDIGTKALIDATGAYVKNTSDYPIFERGQWQILCVQFVQRAVDEYGAITLTPYVFNTGDTFLFVADNDFEDDNSLMMKSYMSATPFSEDDPASNRINIEGDWIDGTTADVTQGQLSVRVNADTAKFTEALGNMQSLSRSLYVNIKQYTAALSTSSSVAWFGFTARNTIRDYGTPEELPADGSIVIPIVNNLLQQGMEQEYSVDGTEWHTTQTDADVYYRCRFRAVDSEWSDAIRMPVGPKGDKGEPGEPGGAAEVTELEGRVTALETAVGNVATTMAAIIGTEE